jgi:hypothetical protein
MNMNKLLISAAVVLGLAGATFAVPETASAARVAVSFDLGNVAFGYQDGYWDRDHRWHRWRHQRDARRYRSEHGDQYHHWRHNRDSDQGWHDEGPGPGDPPPGGPGGHY